MKEETAELSMRLDRLKSAAAIRERDLSCEVAFKSDKIERLSN